MVALLSVIILVVAALLLALPRSNKGLTHAWRYLMLLVGTLAPLVLVWVLVRSSGSIEIVPVLLLVAAIIPNSLAMSLAAAGWQLVLSRRYGIEEALDASLLDPSLYFPSYSGSSVDADDLIGGCLFMLVGYVFVALFIAGAILAGFVDAYLLPDPASPVRRILRAALCFLYALPMQAGSALLLTQIFA